MTNIYNMTDTWDDVGVDWAAIKMNVGDVASSAASKIIDLQKAFGLALIIKTITKLA